MPPHLIFSFDRREDNQGDQKHQGESGGGGAFLFEGYRVQGIGYREENTSSNDPMPEA